MCTYNISDINTAMDKGLTDCRDAENDDDIVNIRPVWDKMIPSGGFDIPAFL